MAIAEKENPITDCNELKSYETIVAYYWMVHLYL